MTVTPTWLVTGAHGFLGANLGAFLSGRAQRIGTVRTPSAPGLLFDRYVAADLEQPGSLAALIEREQPAVVVHTAALASHAACEADPALAERVNAQSSQILAEAAARASSRFVLISTDAVFDGTQGHYAEDDEPNPISVYGATKFRAEQLAARAGDVLTLRTNFFGWSPTGHRSILEYFVNELSVGRPVRGFIDFTTTSAYVQVLVETIWELVQRDATGIFHVASPDALTKYDFGVMVAERFGLPSDLITPAPADVQPSRGRDLSLDVAKVQSELGAALPTQYDGIRRAHADSGALRQSLLDSTAN